MVSAPKTEPAAESSVSGFAPHIEDLHVFFRSRGLGFGSTDDLRTFVERLESDPGFCDEMASMVRTIIYSERDGLSRLELMELLATAVAGAEVDNTAAPEVRESVRKLMAFVDGVFRTKWEPGAPVGGPRPKVSEDEADLSAPQEAIAQTTPVVHPVTDIFYRAQVASNGGVVDTVPEERSLAQNAVPDQAGTAEDPEEGFPDKYTRDADYHVPLEDFVPPEPERGSWAWLLVAGACALLLAFSAGLIVHQRMLVPLRDANQPYEAPPAATAAAQPASVAAAAEPDPTSAATVDADWRARASAKLTPVEAGPAARSTNSVAREEDVASEANLQPRILGPGMIGASPALMAGRLMYAPRADYPALAKMAHLQGKVVVQAVVGKNGRVIRADAISGHRLLRGAAVREVYGRRYRPYLLDGRPRDVTTVVTVNFRLK